MELAAYRKQQNWTLEDVARFIGMSNASAVHKHEIGSTVPKPAIIEAYRKLTGGQVTAEDFNRVAMRYRNAKKSGQIKAA